MGTTDMNATVHSKHAAIDFKTLADPVGVAVSGLWRHFDRPMALGSACHGRRNRGSSTVSSVLETFQLSSGSAH